MNSKQYIATQRILRFRRWSRKGYAAFASLGQCVTIGQVCKSITERALAKQVAPGISYPTKQEETGYDDDYAPTTPVIAICVPTDACPPQITATCPAPRGYTLYNSINLGRDALNASTPITPTHNDYRRD